MLHCKNLDLVPGHSIGNNIARIGDNKLTRACDAAAAAHHGVSGKVAMDGSANRFGDLEGGPRVIPRYVVLEFFEKT
jgi:hypothetical protein